MAEDSEYALSTKHMVPGIAYFADGSPMPQIDDDPKLVEKARRKYRQYLREQRRLERKRRTP